jgi:transposase
MELQFDLAGLRRPYGVTWDCIGGVPGEFARTRVRALPRARVRAACEPSAESGPIGLQLNRSTQQFHRIRLLGDTQQEASSSEVSELRKEKARLEELVARFARGRGVRVSASEKLEPIRLVEGLSLSVRRTLAEIGLPRSIFYAWYKRYLEGGPEARRAPRWGRGLWFTATQISRPWGLPSGARRRCLERRIAASTARSIQAKSCTDLIR